jgi:alpha-tubulin suppressor-like RCC1 family protein
MSCEAFHSIIFTQNSEVYWNDLSKYMSINTNKSERYIGEKIIIISCGKWYSMALKESDLVFGWGYNLWRELGHNYVNDMVMQSIFNRAIK